MESSTTRDAAARTIGRMARESGLTISALRFYDGAGVLRPAHGAEYPVTTSRC